MMVIDGYRIDAEVTGEPTYENEATSFPMESGASTTDHMISKPIMFACEGIVSDTPMPDVQDERTIQGTWTSGGEVDEAITRDANARMIKIWQDRLPVIIKCGLGVFENMLLLTYAPKREGGSLRFTATFQSALFTQNERTTVIDPRSSLKDKIRLIPTNLKDARGRAIFERNVDGVNGKIYVYSDGTPVPQDKLVKATNDAGAVRVNYVNGKAVPVNPQDYQPYGAKEAPYWPQDDEVQKINNSDFRSVGGLSPTTPFQLPD
jgi:hypothetical protein